MFSENANRDATSGSTGKRNEDSVGGKTFLEDNQLDNLEDNQQEEVNTKGGFEFGYEKYIQVSKKTSNQVVNQYLKFSIKKINDFFERYT